MIFSLLSIHCYVNFLLSSNVPLDQLNKGMQTKGFKWLMHHKPTFIHAFILSSNPSKDLDGTFIPQYDILCDLTVYKSVYKCISCRHVCGLKYDQ